MKSAMLGQPLEVVQTDTIKAKYAMLPVIDLTVSYLIEILEPIPQFPVEKILTNASVLIMGHQKALEILLLTEWHNQFKDLPEEHRVEWIDNVDKVELIECDLLVPKNNK